MPFTPYLNVDEIESALESAAVGHPSLCWLITLPNPTFEGRSSHALRIAAGSMTNRRGVLLLGGTHGREWGSSDILIAFLENLISAYETSAGLTFQGKSYSAGEVSRIMESLDLFIFPNVNPDGKAYSQSGHDWRKNRRPVPGAIGVDINRNYDFLWDANVYFSPMLDFNYLYTSTFETYHGIAPFSEAESQNVRWLLDTYQQINYFVDFHSYGQKIMCLWGDDENQSAETEKAFNNAAYNGQRGISSDPYGEFIFAEDNTRQVHIANRMRDAIFAVRGKSYSVGQIFDLVGVSAGDSAPYAFSRHVTSCLATKVFSFGVEWGLSFQPLPAEMLNIMDDIGAAIMELCLCAAEPDLYIRDSVTDIGREPCSGNLSVSPDIITRKALVADPAAAFADPAVDPGSDPVEIGNDNYIYVRVHNRGGQATEAYVRVYFAPLTTSCTPMAWTLIDEVLLPAVPAGGFAVAGPITWPHVPDPGTAGHFCLIALCGNTLDPFPDPSMIDSALDFVRWMRNGNNQAYRNIVFEDTEPDGWAVIPFLVHEFGRKEDRFEFRIDLRHLPRASRTELQVFPELLKQRPAVKTENMVRLRQSRGETQFLIHEGTVGALDEVKIPRGRASRVAIHIQLPETAQPAIFYPLAVIQKIAGQEVGRISIYLRKPKP